MSQDHDFPGRQATVEPLLPPVSTGRRFVGQRKVRLGDVGRDGTLRLDALTRYTQDVSDDDTTDAGLPTEPGWVVRSTVVDELTPAALAETITCETFCSALGKRWAERRLTVTGDGGAHYEVATLWVCVDAAAGRPALLTERFLELYGEAADGRIVSAKLINPKPSAFAGDQLGTRPWPLRVSDYDVYDHVNNAAYWSVVEEWGSGVARPRRIRMEYGAGVQPASSVPVAFWSEGSDGSNGIEESNGTEGSNGIEGSSRSAMLWWLDGDLDSPTLASASISALPSGLYRPTRQR